MNWEKISFVVKSDKRRKILALLISPKTPRQLSKSLRTSLPNISLKLRDLKDKGLVKCVNPGENKGRIYILTEEGKRIIKKIKEMEKE